MIFIDSIYFLASSTDKFADSEDFIVASSRHELTVIEKGTWNTRYIPYPDDLEYADTVYYDKESGHFHVTYEDKVGVANLLEYEKDFSFHTYSLTFPYMEAKFKGNQLYIVAQEEHKKGIGGYVGVFDIHSKETLYQFDLPEEQVKVQDFVVID